MLSLNVHVSSALLTLVKSSLESDFQPGPDVATSFDASLPVVKLEASAVSCAFALNEKSEAMISVRTVDKRISMERTPEWRKW